MTISRIFKNIMNLRNPTRRTRWVCEFNRANIDNIVNQTGIYGESGKEIWSEQDGYFQMSDETGKFQWYRIRYTEHFWEGVEPENNGQELPSREYWKLRKMYKKMYNL